MSKPFAEQGDRPGYGFDAEQGSLSGDPEKGEWLNSHNCDLCGGSERLPLPGDPSGRISICGGCGFVYVPLRRSSAEVAAAWDEIYASGHYNPDWPGVKARLYYVAEWIEQNIGWAGKDVLDIGAGKGQFLRFLIRYPVGTMVGLEPCQRPENIPDGTGWWTATIEKIWAFPEYFDEKFDIITILWTLENTADCLAMLRFARQRLKPGGHVVVATGSRIGYRAFKKPLRHYLPQNPDYPHDTHCFRWSFASLLKAALLCGLDGDKWNDSEDRDEMVMAFKSCEPISNAFPGDDPELIKNHFENWQRLFP